MPSSTPSPSEGTSSPSFAGLIPSSPQAVDPPADWSHTQLFNAVRNTLFALPSFFRSDLVISGVLATDLFTFNSSLGATIETQVVNALNELRSTWDPDQNYTLYRFVRQAQQFPDVILRASAPDLEPKILMGIELKGWYALAKEHEPSFRYKVTPTVCAPWDLLVVYPWALNIVVSGSPQLFQPYVESARYAAEYRNWHWQYKKSGRGNNEINLSSITHFYPTKSEPISDMPQSDNGGNFGRFARTGLMDDYMTTLFREALSGIPLAAWQKFLSLFSEDRTLEEVMHALERITVELKTTKTGLADDIIADIKTHLVQIVQLLSQT